VDQLLGRSSVTYHPEAKRKYHTMPKVKPVTAMKQRLQESLSDLAEQEEVIELIRQAIEMYDLKPMDVFSEDELGAALSPDPVDESIPYCDRAGNTWAGRGRRPTWLVEAIEAGAALEDFRNPAYGG
jgi:DNA-binding protein H-NS